jgi:Bacterial regulatory proteins, luxR family
MDPDVIAVLLTRHAADVPLQTLTPREHEVLALMAEGRSNAAIASRMFITEKAVSKHRALEEVAKEPLLQVQAVLRVEQREVGVLAHREPLVGRRGLLVSADGAAQVQSRAGPGVPGSGRIRARRWWT